MKEIGRSQKKSQWGAERPQLGGADPDPCRWASVWVKSLPPPPFHAKTRGWEGNEGHSGQAVTL